MDYLLLVLPLLCHNIYLFPPHPPPTDNEENDNDHNFVDLNVIIVDCIIRMTKILLIFIDIHYREKTSWLII